MPAIPQALAAHGLAQPQAPTWVDPYEAERQRLQQRMQATPAAMYSPEQVAQRQAQNQREYELGLLGQLSGNEQAGQVGGMVLKRALAQRDPQVSERGVTDQITGKFTYSPDYLRRQDESAMAGLEQKSAASKGAFDAGRIAFGDKQALQDSRMEDMKELRRIAGDAKNGQEDARIWRGEDALRGDFDRLTKDLREEIGATSKITQIVKANAGRRPDAITQQSLVILLNKFLDPGSVVREGEFDRVVKAQGLEGRAMNLRDYLLKGEPLNDAAIAQINSLAGLYSQAATAKMRQHAAEYERIAGNRGFDPANVVSDPAYRGGGAPQQPAAAAPQVIDVGAALKQQANALPQTMRSVLPKQPPGATHGARGRVVQVDY
jgi:hypothetical protein